MPFILKNKKKNSSYQSRSFGLAAIMNFKIAARLYDISADIWCCNLFKMQNQACLNIHVYTCMPITSVNCFLLIVIMLPCLLQIGCHRKIL